MSRLGQNFADAISSLTMMTDGVKPNGRIDLLSPMPLFDIPSYQRTLNQNNSRAAQEAVSGQITVNGISELFFSPKNIDALQHGIRYRVYVETNGQYTIGRQSDTELKIVMRSVYFQHGRNTAGECVGQVRELNAKVLDWVVPEVLSNVLQYSTYRVDASTLPMPMDRSPNMSARGTKSLELKSFM